MGNSQSKNIWKTTSHTFIFVLGLRIMLIISDSLHRPRYKILDIQIRLSFLAKDCLHPIVIVAFKIV